ncbi:MAG: transcriptional regulator [Coxiella sp. (in: Bacteria)]|nr:MAG: transcriptional regulator [Coxiella sp. (in: g-proteobacteria)]
MPKSVFTVAYKTFLKTIIRARKDAGVTQVELACSLGKPQPWVSNYENGIRRIDIIEFYAVARAIGADPVDLFTKIARKLPKKVEV